MAFVYILHCSDGSYYVGLTRATLDARIGQHRLGMGSDYTRRRRPVRLVWHQEFRWITDAIAAERRIKGWSRAKKEALIRGDMEALRLLARKPGRRPSEDGSGDGRREQPKPGPGRHGDA